MNWNRTACRKRRILSLLLIFCLTLSFLPAASAAEDKASAMLKTMTTEEKVSQMIMPAFRWWNDAEGKRQNLTELNGEIAALLERHGFAGVILFGQNAAETEAAARLVDAMQCANAKGGNRARLLMAIDQEGGSVTRLGQGTAFPGNMALGAANDTDVTKAAARTIGAELKAIGFHFDFAPVVDVNNNPANPVIATRSFSDDPRLAAKHGAAFVEALAENGTISALKHFPGHGDTGTDSHTGLPMIEKTCDELKANELLPFQACIDAGAEAVMTAHIQYPAIETETYVSKASGENINLPATLSKTILTGILRGDMGFGGVILTDAMDMDAISKNFDPMDAARLAIGAGVDILLMPVDPGALVDAEGVAKLDQYVADLAKLADEGAIPMARIDESVARILALKEKHGLLDAYDGSDLDARVANALAAVGSKEHHALEWEVAKRAVTLVKNDGVLPLTKENQKIAVLTAYDNEVLSMEYAVNRLKDEGKLAAGTEVAVTSIQKKALEDCLPLVEGANHVIAVSEAGSLAALNPEGAKGAYSALLDALIAKVHEQGGTFTVLSASLPYDAARYTEADAFVVTWNARGMSEDPRVTDGPVKQFGASMPAALYLMLSPDETPQGALPVNIPRLNGEYKYSDELLYRRGFGLAYDTSARFSDLDAGAWYMPGVRYVLTHQIMDGEGEDFLPGGTVSRAAAVEALWRMAGRPEAAETAPAFADVPAGSRYERAVRWAAEAGVVNGFEDGTFRGDSLLTREQFAALLFRYAGAAEEPGVMGLAGYQDSGSVSGWARPAMAWAVRAGLLQGVGEGMLAPRGSLTRAQLAVILTRFDEA
ncbi:MAG: S-layer homology domain-containing protein [Oscillospiraceae bacterium]|nr:S-layer homology domain-containing protein [Oscillospiraceae bacterium]